VADGLDISNQARLAPVRGRLANVSTMQLCGGSLPVSDPETLLGDYLNPTYGYAWPAYDTLVTNGSATLVTGDLLAPALLEAHIDSARFGVLVEMLPHLSGVGDLPAHSLAEATDEDVAAVAGLFAVLDTEQYRRRGVRGTIVSKVLHRKRPDLVPLYDSRIDAGYRASGRITHDPHRPWVDFMDLLCKLMREDLQREEKAFAGLVELAAERGAPITALRILDILVWMALEDG
jgi:hypothetical protein